MSLQDLLNNTKVVFMNCHINPRSLAPVMINSYHQKNCIDRPKKKFVHQFFDGLFKYKEE